MASPCSTRPTNSMWSESVKPSTSDAAVIVAIALLIALVNVHPPIVLFAMFCLYGMSGYAVYAWRRAKGQRTSVIATSTDEPEEKGLHP